MKTTIELKNGFVAGERNQDIIKKAIEKGFSVDSRCDFENISIDAENYLIENTEHSIEIVADFWNNPNYLLYVDENNVTCCEQFGQIVADEYEMRYYARIQNGKIVEDNVKWCFNDEEDVYCYLDTIVKSNGEVVELYA